MISHNDLNTAFRFRVPDSYVSLLQTAEQLNPADPWNALNPLQIYYMDNCGLTAMHAESPPELIIFGWTGSDDGHYAFIVDDPRPVVEEYSIGLFYGDGTLQQVVASSIPEFLGVLCRQVLDDSPEGDELKKYKRVANALQSKLNLTIPRNSNATIKRATLARRKLRDIAETEDGFGVILPSEVTDRKYLGSIKWPETCFPTEPQIPRNDRLLDEAERRLDAGEAGTALIVARNYFYHYAYDRKRSVWKTRVQRIRTIMEDAYRALGRSYAADVLRARTKLYFEWNDLK